jgi:hypothetical protein
VSPQRTLIYRMVHVDNLTTLARRGGLHAPACSPDDGLPYLAIHDESIRIRRGGQAIPCGPRGTVDDYVSFYLGHRSPMLYRIWKGAVKYEGGQRPVVYLVSSVERLQELGSRFVFSDGHSLSALTRWYDNPAALSHLDWDTVQTSHWADTEDDPDRCRRKQAELLVYQFVPWDALLGIAVMDESMQKKVEDLLRNELSALPYVNIREDWYYRS